MIQENVVIMVDDLNRDGYAAFPRKDEKVEIVSTEKGIDHLRNTRMDVIILDSGEDLPRGLNLVIDIKTYACHVPVIFLTDIRSYEAAVMAYKLGVRDYIRKPISIPELRGLVMGILAFKRMSREKRIPLPCINNSASCQVNVEMSRDIPENFTRVVCYIENNLDKVFHLDDIARQANMSKYHFSRKFKEATGLSPMAYTRGLKIHKAKDLLETRDISIAAVAEEVGYADIRNFERQFKMDTGLTPSSYRKSRNDGSKLLIKKQ